MGSPTLSSQPKGYHARMDDNDNNMHYPKGFIAADDNTFIVKGNDSELAHHLALQVAKIKVTSAELKAIATTPKTLIEAPGSGKVIALLYGYYWLDYNSTDYNATDDIDIDYSSGGDLFSINSASIEESADYINDVDNFKITEYKENESVVITSDSNPTDGDSDLYIWVAYHILEQW